MYYNLQTLDSGVSLRLQPIECEQKWIPLPNHHVSAPDLISTYSSSLLLLLFAQKNNFLGSFEISPPSRWSILLHMQTHHTFSAIGTSTSSSVIPSHLNILHIWK